MVLQNITSYLIDTTNGTAATLGIFLATLISAKAILNMLWKDNRPPGPRGVPLLGYLPYFGTHPHLTFFKLREKYGDVFSIQMGSFPAVVISGKELIKEVLVTRGDEFSGRPNFYTSTLLGSDSLSFGHFDHSAILHKKITYSCLHLFSNARMKQIEEMIFDEAKIAVSEFSNQNGKPFFPGEILFASVGSFIYQACYGTHTNIREEGTFHSFLENSREFANFAGSGNPVNVMPWLRFVMPGKVSTYLRLRNKTKAVRNTKLTDSLKSFSPSHVRHLADGFTAAAKEADEDPNSVLTSKRIFQTLDDLTGAGFDTVSVTLNWAVLLLTAHPEVQRKVHAEIDDVLGNRQPRLEDKTKMPYCMATISEISRFADIAPLSVPHATTIDTQLNGYKIAKGTAVLLNVYTISHDKDLWGDPFNFRPERYLDQAGRLDQNIAGNFNPFSWGRRKCVGENFARMELFLFITGIFQNCVFTKPAHIEEYSMDSIFGLTVLPVPYEVCASLRY
ncbi:cytochrome P450 1A1 [Patella vulgata]|uniref:cytochrome P450 1A1 n=1 Tax=Patella vulgata TaxID=6465 RepID=UPI0021804547|nr:cytochrome P450 1A1 [Patella vulgata]